MSYANAIMYSRVLPSYDTDRKRKGKKNTEHERIDGNDPANKEALRELFKGS